MRGARGVKNAGPAAAEANREALLLAARQVFDERGPSAPLSAVAREAAVSQAVLYRHFPTRVALAEAISQDGMRELELAATSDVVDFDNLWENLVNLVVQNTVFIELLVHVGDEAGRAMEARLLELIADKLAVAQAAGQVSEDLTPTRVLLAQRMVYGAVISAPRSDRVRAAQDALSFLPHDLGRARISAQ